MQLQRIKKKIIEVRGIKIILDFDIAMLYEVETRVLKQAVKRNIDLFPEDFMFELNREELQILTSQNVISSSDWGGTRYLPFAFTEHGVAMLANILKSKKARQTSISIIRAFVLMRQYALTHKDLTDKIVEIEKKYNKKFNDVYEAINYLLGKDKKELEQQERKRIGF